MRILACADLHASEAKLRWVSQQNAYDLVAISGDLLDLNPYRMTPGQIEMVSSFIAALKLPTVICSGNHDSFSDDDDRLAGAAWLLDLRRPNLWLDGDCFRLGGYTFRALGWMSPLPEATADEIWVTHCPPDMTATSIVRGGTDWGDFEYGELCRNKLGPRISLSGHCHDRQHWNAKIGRTWSFNPGFTANSIPAHVVIDLSRNTAAFHSTVSSLASRGPLTISLL